MRIADFRLMISDFGRTAARGCCRGAPSNRQPACSACGAATAGRSAIGNRLSAFTLIEVMVAVTVLAMLVMIMSTIFHQSSLAWDSGTGRMKANVMARAVLNLIGHELQHAVADDLLNIQVDTRDASNPNEDKGHTIIRFWTADGDADLVSRQMRWIEYSTAGGKPEVWRREWILPADQLYADAIAAKITGAPDHEVAVATNVVRLKFQGWPEMSSAILPNLTRLPRGVKIMLELERSDRISDLAAWSYGPDGQDGTEDDIGSW